MRNFNKLKKDSILILIGLLWSVAGYSGENTNLPSKEIKNIEGVYKHQFSNAFVSGEKYRSEDVIEIVRYAPDAIYFRVRLEFYNGHSCGIYGIAKYSDDAFIYKNKDASLPKEACTLKISNDNKVLKITDRINENSPSTCSEYCGVRGSLGSYDISMARRRKIKYMPIILKSTQYIEAVDEYKKNNNVK